MTSPFIFHSSLPRSGSTLLQNILGQNPHFHVTPTSGVADLLINARDHWGNLPEFQAQVGSEVKPRISSMFRGMLEGYYAKELAVGKTVVEKSRAWIAYIELLEEVLQKPVKVISLMRDVRSILASFEKLHRKNPLSEKRSNDYYSSQTLEGRCGLLLQADGMLGIAINRFRDAVRRLPDRLVILAYHDLINQPKGTLDYLHYALGIPPFEYNFNNIQTITQENDDIYGVPLHAIRSQVAPSSDVEWKTILPDHIASHVSSEYMDIQSLAKVRS